MISVGVVDVRRLGPFDFRWPDEIESFEGGWAFDAYVDGVRHAMRLGVGACEVFGRVRVHAVTWVDGEVQVEGAEADDYPASQALISRLRRPGRGLAFTRAEVPAGYRAFEIVDHRREIDAPYSPRCLAVKIREDDLTAWALHGWLRSQLPRKSPAAARTSGTEVADRGAVAPPPSPDAERVTSALLAHADALASQLKSAVAQFTYDPNADALIRSDAFAFLLAVVSDLGIRAERAWALPYELHRRLGHLSPKDLAANPEAVRAVVQRPPKLHRFVNVVPDWLVQASNIVLDRYQGEAERLWSDVPTATELRRRLEEFPGVSQKRAAMAVEILTRDLGKPVREMNASDVANDVHLRRVFLRTGLAERDDVNQMVAVARQLCPDRPGALDVPAWDIGRRWCRPALPDCPSCPLNYACPRLIDRGSRIRGV